MPTQLPVNQPNLSQILGPYSIAPAASAGMQEMQANENNALNQAGFLQDFMQSQDKHPLDMQNKQLQNQGLEAGLPGIFANSGMLTRQNRMGGATEEMDVERKLSDNYTQISKNDSARMKEFSSMLARLGAAAEKGIALPELMGLPPELRAIVSKPGGGTQLRELAEGMIRSDPSILEENAKQEAMTDRQLKIEALKNERAERVASIAAKNRVDIQKAKEAAAGTKSSKNLRELATKYLEKANTPSLPLDEQKMYADLAQETYKAAFEYDVGVRQAGNPTDVSPAGVTGLPARGTPEVPMIKPSVEGPALGTKENPIKLD